jgi:flagellar FliL protein
MAIENQFDEEANQLEEAQGEDLLDEDEAGIDAKKIILFIVLPLLLLVGVGATLHFTGALDKMKDTGKEEVAAASDKPGTKKQVNVSAHFLEIPSIVVNLSSPEGQPRYLRLSVQLELESAADLVAVESVMPRVVDQFQTYLRELRERDLKGSAGIYRLQIELLNRVNTAAYPIEVKDVLFQEILIQ